MDTVEYYNRNSQLFLTDTQDVKFDRTQSRFLAEVRRRGGNASPLVLDCGCGSGRDSKYFSEHHCRVEAIDGSIEMVKAARRFSGVDVQLMDFRNLAEKSRYDGIWACASLLHLHREELPEMFRKLSDAMTPHGVLYVSFKYGSFSGVRNGRYYTDLTEGSLKNLILAAGTLRLLDLWITSDVRPGRRSELWLNGLAGKIDPA